MMSVERFKHYKLGIPEIDKEHFELFELLNAVEVAIINGDYKSAKEHFDDFFIKLDIHGINEEEMMNLIEYPFMKIHVSQHPESTMQMLKYRNKREDEMKFLTVTKIESLFADHIDKDDSQYVPYYLKFYASLN